MLENILTKDYILETFTVQGDIEFKTDLPA
jgi:hypothetical protein